MSEKIRRSFSILLVLALLINILPINILAAAMEDSVTTDSAISQGDTASKKNKGPTGKDIVGEEISKRTADTKHFKLKDGSYIAVQYGTNVHYKDKDGKWQDINNKLLPEDSLDTSGASGTAAPGATDPQVDSTEANTQVTPENQKTSDALTPPEAQTDSATNTSELTNDKATAETSANPESSNTSDVSGTAAVSNSLDSAKEGSEMAMILG